MPNIDEATHASRSLLSATTFEAPEAFKSLGRL